jgi:5-methyltetrahydropteroyltriglutamate--homocysteine methyltransferase
MISARTDHVGSLLRPPELLQAREELAAGEIELPEFKAIEDAAIDDVVALQEAAGCEVVTDGEFRRLSFQSQITDSVEGFGTWDLEAFLWGDWYGDDVGDWHRPRPDDIGVIGKLVRRRHLSAEEFTYLRGRTGRVAKVTLPSPSLLANFWSSELSRDFYPTLDDFLVDVTEILRQEVLELERLGCRYIQLDAPHYPLLIDEGTRRFYEGQGWSLDAWLGRGIELDNTLIDATDKITFGFHLCRGNQGNRYLVSGGYEPIAQKIFQGVHADRLLLEYDDERSGDFQPLQHVPDDKMVVLGIMTTKSPRLEAKSDLERRVREAAKVIDLEQLAISPQCGFSTSIVGNDLNSDDQAAKLQRLAETAAEIWN